MPVAALVHPRQEFEQGADAHMFWDLAFSEGVSPHINHFQIAPLSPNTPKFADWHFDRSTSRELHRSALVRGNRSSESEIPATD